MGNCKLNEKRKEYHTCFLCLYLQLLYYYLTFICLLGLWLQCANNGPRWFDFCFAIFVEWGLLQEGAFCYVFGVMLFVNLWFPVQIRYAFELLTYPLWKRDYDIYGIDEQLVCRYFLFLMMTCLLWLHLFNLFTWLLVHSMFLLRSKNNMVGIVSHI